MISDNCQQWLQDLFPGLWQPVPGSALRSFGLDYFPLHVLPYVYQHWSSYANIMPFFQFCEILQDCFAIGVAFHCPKEVMSIRRPRDFVHASFCGSWMKILNKTSLSTHPLLPPLHPKALPFASHSFTYSQSKNEHFLQILCSVSLMIKKKVQWLWGSNYWNVLLTFIVLVAF